MSVSLREPSGSPFLGAESVAALIRVAAGRPRAKLPRAVEVVLRDPGLADDDDLQPREGEVVLPIRAVGRWLVAGPARHRITGESCARCFLYAAFGRDACGLEQALGGSLELTPQVAEAAAIFVRRAAKAAAAASPRVHLFDTRTGRTSVFHWEHPHPRCPTHAALAAGPGAQSDLAEALSMRDGPAPKTDASSFRETLVDSKCGIVRRIGLVDVGLMNPIPGGQGLLSVAVGLRARPIVGGVEPCSSVAVDPDAAITRAMMEGVERWCTEGAAHRSVVVGRWEDVPNALNPGELHLYSEEQYRQPEWPYPPWTLDTSMLWTEGFNTLTKAPQMVPLESVTSVWPADAPPPICQLTSIGSAAHRSYGAAVVGALFELIERDAVMRWWYRLIEPEDGWSWSLPRDVATPTLAPAARSVRVIDIGSDSVVPVMLALVMSDDGTPPHLALGAGAAMTRGAAVRRAVLEAVGNIVAFAQRASPGPPRMNMHPREHGQLYAWDAAQGGILDGLVLPARDEPPPEGLAANTEPAVPTTMVLARMAKRGFTTVIVDLTPPTLHRRGVRVVRAVVPQLIPMCFGLGQDRWGSFVADIAPWWRDRIRGIVHPFP